MLVNGCETREVFVMVSLALSILWMIRGDLGIQSRPEGRRWRGMWHSQQKELPQQAIVIFKEVNSEKWQVRLFSLSDNSAKIWLLLESDPLGLVLWPVGSLYCNTHRSVHRFPNSLMHPFGTLIFPTCFLKEKNGLIISIFETLSHRSRLLEQKDYLTLPPYYTTVNTKSQKVK